MAKLQRSRARRPKAAAVRRTHAIRLVRTLLHICRQLRSLQTDPAARAANREVGRRLQKIKAEFGP